MGMVGMGDMMNKKRLEYYSAEWCGPCKAYKPTIQKLKDEGMAITIYDIDRDTEMTEKAGIMSVPTTIIYKDGEVLERLVGIQSKENIEYLMSE